MTIKNLEIIGYLIHRILEQRKPYDEYIIPILKDDVITVFIQFDNMYMDELFHLEFTEEFIEFWVYGISQNESVYPEYSKDDPREFTNIEDFTTLFTKILTDVIDGKRAEAEMMVFYSSIGRT